MTALKMRSWWCRTSRVLTRFRCYVVYEGQWLSVKLYSWAPVVTESSEILVCRSSSIYYQFYIARSFFERTVLCQLSRAGHRSPYMAYIRYPYYGSRHRTVEASGRPTVRPFLYGSCTGQSNPARFVFLSVLRYINLPIWSVAPVFDHQHHCSGWIAYP